MTYKAVGRASGNQYHDFFKLRTEHLLLQGFGIKSACCKLLYQENGLPEETLRPQETTINLKRFQCLPGRSMTPTCSIHGSGQQRKNNN
jgi:hypothetical protein